LGLNHDILDTMAVVGPEEPALGSRRMSSTASISCDGDSIHLCREAYMDVAGAIVEISAAGGSGVDADDSDSGSGCSDATKRRRHPDSIMMLPVPPLRKRGRGAGPPAAGWLRGEAETRARDARGHGSRVCRHRGVRASVGAARRPGSWDTGAGA
jgi:hypothetical protein